MDFVVISREDLAWLMVCASIHVEDGKQHGAGDSISPAAHEKANKYWSDEEKKLKELQQKYSVQL